MKIIPNKAPTIVRAKPKPLRLVNRLPTLARALEDLVSNEHVYDYMSSLKEDASDDEADEVECAVYTPMTNTVPNLPRKVKPDEMASFKVD